MMHASAANSSARRYAGPATGGSPGHIRTGAPEAPFVDGPMVCSSRSRAGHRAVGRYRDHGGNRAKTGALPRPSGTVSDWLVVSPAPFRPRLRRVRSARRRAITVSLHHGQLPKPRYRQAARHWCFCTTPHLRWSSRCNSRNSGFDNNNGHSPVPQQRQSFGLSDAFASKVRARPRSRARALVLVASNAAS
jgi:hypothetical protein